MTFVKISISATKNRTGMRHGCGQWLSPGVGRPESHEGHRAYQGDAVPRGGL